MFQSILGRKASHILREGNVCADFAVNNCRTTAGQNFFCTCNFPRELIELAVADARESNM